MAGGIIDITLPVAGELLAGKYRVERLIGQGGMGAVFAAHHEILLQRVAIKFLLTEHARNPSSVSRFLNEARAMARIQDEHVARVMDVGTLENGTAFMVLEYLDGVDLATLGESRGPLPLVEVIDYAVQALEALGQAHSLGIVHRDIKPSNLFLARRPNGSSCLKLLDFGISKGANPFAAESSALTSTGAIMGSPAYMSPEQLRNSKTVDARTDIWSLGVVIYELLSGKPPFGGDTLGAVLTAIVEADVRPLEKRSDVPAVFETVLLRCLARKPEERFASAAELAAALRPFASPSALASIQRVCENHPAPEGAPMRVSRSEPGPAQASAAAQTGASWAPPTEIAQSGPAKRGPARVLLPLSIAGLVALGSVAAFVLTGRHLAPPPFPGAAAGKSSGVVSALPPIDSAIAVAATASAGASEATIDAGSPTRTSASSTPPNAPASSAEPSHSRGSKGGARSGSAPLPSHSPPPPNDHPPVPPATSTYDPSHDSRK